MIRTKESLNKSDKRLAAVCGLFCPACTIFIATREDSERLKRIAESIHLSVEDMKCYGYRSEKRPHYCEKCKMVTFAAEKDMLFKQAID